MTNLLGDYSIKDVLSEEVLIVAYDYNSQEPRFYSKYNSRLDPKIYDVKIGEATGASSAAPTFFDPKLHIDGYGFTELEIDGGIICNNPALYAYEIAKNFHKKSKVRILSLGTGENPFAIRDPEKMTKLTYMSLLNEFMMNADTYTADNYLNHTLPE
jgi:patatin-like phospholipase/acyl hydrolase